MNRNFNTAARVDASKLAQYPLPGDIIADLQDAFNFYDKEETGYISMSHFRNILHNFGFRSPAAMKILLQTQSHASVEVFLIKLILQVGEEKIVSGACRTAGAGDEGCAVTDASAAWHALYSASLL